MTATPPAGPHRRLARGVAAVLAMSLAACTAAGGPKMAPRPVRPTGEITVASFDFPESKVLASLYAQRLRGAGFPVRLLQGVGSREIVEPALVQGLIGLVPEYAGSALQFFGLGRAQPTPDVGATHSALAEALAERGIAALEPAPAQDSNAIVVTERTARMYGLRRVSDLARVGSKLVFGGPPECPERPFCLLGLERTYGVRFGSFVALDSGGPLTLTALTAQEVDVGLLFTTDPNVSLHHLVVLADDRALQPAENVTPVIREDLLRRYGPALAGAVDSVSALLSTDELRDLVHLVTVDGRSPGVAAAHWLRTHGFGT